MSGQACSAWKFQTQPVQSLTTGAQQNPPHQKNQPSVQNVLAVGVLCCPRANAGSATGAPIGDTGELVDHHHHHHHHHGADQERHGHSGSPRWLHLHRVFRQRLQREQRDGPSWAMGPLGGLLKVHLWPLTISIYVEMSVSSVCFSSFNPC